MCERLPPGHMKPIDNIDPVVDKSCEGISSKRGRGVHSNHRKLPRSNRWLLPAALAAVATLLIAFTAGEMPAAAEAPLVCPDEFSVHSKLELVPETSFRTAREAAEFGVRAAGFPDYRISSVPSQSSRPFIFIATDRNGMPAAIIEVEEHSNTYEPGWITTCDFPDADYPRSERSMR